MASVPEPTAAPPSTVHAAERTFDGSGIVDALEEITDDEAADRRRRGLDIVVCGEDLATNRHRAARIEGMVGPYTRPQPPHPSAGPYALPHYHQQSRSPDGHSFYETPKRKARRRP